MGAESMDYDRKRAGAGRERSEGKRGEHETCQVLGIWHIALLAFDTRTHAALLRKGFGARANLEEKKAASQDPTAHSSDKFGEVRFCSPQRSYFMAEHPSRADCTLPPEE